VSIAKIEKRVNRIRVMTRTWLKKDLKKNVMCTIDGSAKILWMKGRMGLT
jgi:hypothetical protein